MNHEQALTVARRYCQIREAQDGRVHDPVQQAEVALIMAAWFMAFKEYVDRGGPL
jgi:hypothetical protein